MFEAPLRVSDGFCHPVCPFIAPFSLSERYTRLLNYETTVWQIMKTITYVCVDKAIKLQEASKVVVIIFIHSFSLLFYFSFLYFFIKLIIIRLPIYDLDIYLISFKYNKYFYSLHYL